MSSTTPILLSISAPVVLSDAIPDADSTGTVVPPPVASFNIVADGDSITAGFDDPANGYPEMGVALINGTRDITLTKTAVPGSTLTDLLSRASSDDALLDTTKTNIFSVMIGTNDMSGGGGSSTATTFVASLKTYCQARQAAGWKVLLCTTTSNTYAAGIDETYSASNQLIRDDHSFYDCLADFGADPVMGPNGTNGDNTTYFHTDKVHPTQTGFAILAGIWADSAAALCDDTAQAVTSITISPSSASVAAGAQRQYSATAYDQFGAVMITQPTFTWSTTNGSITSGGLLTAGSAASGQTVTASAGGVNGTSALTVTAAASYELIAHTQATPSSNGGTTSAIDTTGANLLILVSSYYYVGTPSTPTDSKGNTWIGRTAYVATAGGNISAVRIWYAENPTVGSGHTFTQTGTGFYPAISVLAFSGAATSSVYDTENGADAGSTETSQATGSITPSVDGELLVAAYTSNGDTSALTIDNGFAITDKVSFNGASNMAGAVAWKLQTTAASINPTWTWTGSVAPTVAIASFKPA